MKNVKILWAKRIIFQQIKDFRIELEKNKFHFASSFFFVHKESNRVTRSMGTNSIHRRAV